MIKKIVTYLTVFIILYYLCFYTHQYFIEKNTIVLAFSLEKLYLFLAGFSILVCVNLLLLSTINNLLNVLGFVYLFTIILKIISFCAVFYKSILLQENMADAVRISIVLPILLFLFVEVFFVVNILNTKDYKK